MPSAALQSAPLARPETRDRRMRVGLRNAGADEKPSPAHHGYAAWPVFRDFRANALNELRDRLVIREWRSVELLCQ